MSPWEKRTVAKAATTAAPKSGGSAAARVLTLAIGAGLGWIARAGAPSVSPFASTAFVPPRKPVSTTRSKEQLKAARDSAKKAFLAAFDGIRDELLADPVIAVQPATGQTWMKRVLDYNVPFGKLNRGMAVADTLAVLRGVEDANALSKSDLKDAHVLGWCIELLQAFFLVADDIMDDSVTRRGQPCWFRVEDVGMVAINDGILLESAIYRLLKNHFAKHRRYADMLEVFHEVTFQTATGQMLDLITAPIGKVDLSKYTMETYTNIVVYKTAFYTFYLPVACGMLLGGVRSTKAYDTAKEICVAMGEYFQVQDDFLDCYGAPEVIGKIGTDIGDNKCGWLVCKALLKANDAQREVIAKNYGKPHDSVAEAAVKAVYNEMDLKSEFEAYENKSYEMLRSMIDTQKDLPVGIFDELLAKIFKRSK
ncbi:farnesyl pyrophosphate synthase [Pycnococcus provasolii]